MPERSRDRPRILIVDDQLSMAETVADGLAENGYDALALASSPQLWRFAQASRIAPPKALTARGAKRDHQKTLGVRARRAGPRRG